MEKSRLRRGCDFDAVNLLIRGQLPNRSQAIRGTFEPRPWRCPRAERSPLDGINQLVSQTRNEAGHFAECIWNRFRGAVAYLNVPLPKRVNDYLLPRAQLSFGCGP